METKMRAIAVNDTWLKDSARNSDQCGSTDFAKAGTVLELEYSELQDHSNHHYFVLYPKGGADQGIGGETRLWGFCNDWKIEGTETGNDPTESRGDSALVAPKPELTIPKLVAPERTYKIPGISAPIARYQPVYKGSNFTWDEVLWGSATGDNIRMPEDAGITERLVNLIKYMDLVREDLGGRPIKVTSCYRDPITNRAVGGALYSQHRLGRAIDFRVIGEEPVETFRKLKAFRGGTLSLAVGDGFVHLDLRPGAPARWTYPRGPRVALW